MRKSSKVDGRRIDWHNSRNSNGRTRHDEFLRLVESGASAKMISEALAISRESVRNRAKFLEITLSSSYHEREFALAAPAHPEAIKEEIATLDIAINGFNNIGQRWYSAALYRTKQRLIRGTQNIYKDD